jgi:hypothetical protein
MTILIHVLKMLKVKVTHKVIFMLALTYDVYCIVV